MAGYLQDLFTTCCGRSKPPHTSPELYECDVKPQRIQSTALESRTTLTSLGTMRLVRQDTGAVEPLQHAVTSLDEAAGQLSICHAEHLKCGYCDQDASGFCVGCTAVRYCRGCFKVQHKRKTGLHMFCSYSNTIPAVLARFQARQATRSDTDSV